VSEKGIHKISALKQLTLCTQQTAIAHLLSLLY